MEILRFLKPAASKRILAHMSLAIGCFVLAASCASADEVKRVLILCSNESFLPANIALGNSLVGHMRAELPGRVELFSEFLDLVRFTGEAHQTRTADALRAKYDGWRIDLLVIVGPQALDLLAAHRETLFPGVPVVFTGVREDNTKWHGLASTTGIFMRLDPVPTLELALRLQPGTRKVVVVTGASGFDRAWDTVARECLRGYEGRLEFVYFAGLPMQQLLGELSRLEPNAVVIYLSVFSDGAGQYFLSADAARLVAEASAAPVYGLYDTYLGCGIVGGRMDTFEHVGRETGRLALRVLAGERPEIIAPYLPSDSVTVVDWRQLNRWGLSERLLPTGSDVRYRQSSLWEEHRGMILAVVAVTALQTALVIGLLIQRRNQRRAEQEVEETRQELAHAARLAIVGELTASIAHEINQPLGAILSNADAAEMLLDSSPESLDEVRQILDDIRQDDLRAGDVIRRLRVLLRKRAMEMQPVDLIEVISEVLGLIRAEAGRRGVAIEAELAAELPLVHGDKVHLQQVLLNLMLNGMEAMADMPGAKKLTVRNGLDGNGSVEIAVIDGGPGIASDRLHRLFDPFFTTKNEGMGLGLPIARTIVEAHGGRIWAENHAGGGATFRFTVPTGVERANGDSSDPQIASGELTT